MKPINLRPVLILFLCLGYQTAHALAPASVERIVNLGDSITDGQTYALLIEQALREAGKPVPKFFGAGIGGDTAAGMLKRLDRDVLSHRPTLVMLSCGINDVAGGVKLADFEATVTAIAERLSKEKVKLMLLTTTNLRGGQASETLTEVKVILQRIAARYNFPVADVYNRMEASRKVGLDLWESDGCHLNFTGYRSMTRAILDAMGFLDVSVPAEAHLYVLPGLIARWKILALKEEQPRLDEKSLAALKVDATWHDYTLPEPKPVSNWWLDQERQRAVCVSLQDTLGPAKSFIAVADVESPRARKAFINPGGESWTTWFNGKRVYGPGDPPRGWHPGAYRIPVELRRGHNQIVVESGGRFFVSITDTNDW